MAVSQTREAPSLSMRPSTWGSSASECRTFTRSTASCQHPGKRAMWPRRLRVIRRLELDSPSPELKATLDRFTRLANFGLQDVGCARLHHRQGQAVLFVANRARCRLDRIRRRILLPYRHRVWSAVLNCARCGSRLAVPPQPSGRKRPRQNPILRRRTAQIRRGRKTAIIGSLCVIDTKPRSFSSEDQSLLKDLAACVVSEVGLLTPAATTTIKILMLAAARTRPQPTGHRTKCQVASK